ncbi:hypothetical protein ACFFGT_08915 [Mucilaginibacter angelicae]|uniref:Tetratricopeptide repeat protein n=1 Tax=Mucilaginibacter angelicae TaxID=869718 RepID=A0ABV6L4D6_9SPHI
MKLNLPVLNFKREHVSKTAMVRPIFNLTVYFSGEGELPESKENSIPAQQAETPEETINPGTVCAFCKKDYGTLLNKLSVYPICDNCSVDLEKKIFPQWVKLFFGGVILLVVFSIFWNWRFYAGYNNLNKANIAFSKSDVSNAAQFMTKAAEEVPETRDLVQMAAYFRGIDFLSKDKSAFALAEFNKCKDLGADFHINQWILNSEIGVAYDKKDYPMFLKTSRAVLELDSTVAQSWAGVASAYACLYAQNGQDSLKQLSLQYLQKARKLDDTSTVSKDYTGRILYRIDSKQIISRDEFLKKFPNGYTSALNK